MSIEDSDDVSQRPRAGRADEQADLYLRTSTLLHRRLDHTIDQLHQPGLGPAERHRLHALHDQIRADIAAIRHGGSEHLLRTMQRKYRS